MTVPRFVAIVATASAIILLAIYMARHPLQMDGPGGTFTPRDTLIQMNGG